MTAENRAGNIFQRAINGIRETLQRREEERRLTEERLARGEITPEDRTKYIDNETSRIFYLYQGTLPSRLGGGAIFPSSTEQAITNQIAEVTHLPEEELDARIKTEAQMKIQQRNKPLGQSS